MEQDSYESDRRVANGIGSEQVDKRKKQIAKSKEPVLAKVRETGRDEDFIAYDDGTVLDTKTNLMWAAEDNGRDINWQDAKIYCEDYRGGGYTDWRMPTLDELAGLYDEDKSYGFDNDSEVQYDVHLSELIQLSGWLWSSEKRGSDAAYFVFYYGIPSWAPRSGGTYRALPVRSDK